mmetsp:Transcript_33774/g.77186  ORF Transcript_33774/g.77186 Transcript_33774/m.77186 type:complete len:174 (+) Transcript_33774:1367-1888(+)
MATHKAPPANETETCLAIDSRPKRLSWRIFRGGLLTISRRLVSIHGHAVFFCAHSNITSVTLRFNFRGRNTNIYTDKITLETSTIVYVPCRFSRPSGIGAVVLVAVSDPCHRQAFLGCSLLSCSLPQRFLVLFQRHHHMLPLVLRSLPSSPILPIGRNFPSHHGTAHIKRLDL